MQQLQQQQQPQEQPATQSMPAMQVSANTASAVEVNAITAQDKQQPISEDFQLVEASDVAMADASVMDSKLQTMPALADELTNASILTTATIDDELKAARKTAALASLGGPQVSSLVGDSLIEMVINLRNENESLVRALEVNNQFVKQRLADFKKAQEEAERREHEFASQKADLESSARKLNRQNAVLSERLKVMESKLSDMRLEVNDTLTAARDSNLNSPLALSSLASGQQQLYPKIPTEQPMRVDEKNYEANKGDNDNDNDEDDDDDDVDVESGSESESESPLDEDDNGEHRTLRVPSAPDSVPFGAGARHAHQAATAGNNGDADSDPLRQCDKLEARLGELGRRDYEICLLQQQLNIYRQDFRAERMQKLDARIQIEKLKADIERLCAERAGAQAQQARALGGPPPPPLTTAAAAGAVAGAAAASVGRLGVRLQRKVARSAARAARHAAKQAHLEEKLAARVASATKTAAEHSAAASASGSGGEHRHAHHRRSRNGPRVPGIGSEIVGDLLQTANKAMLTGYKLTSTHVNLALDKLAEFEQSQASKLANEHHK